MTPANIACLVLASGMSQRFGDADKLQAPLLGETVLAHVLKTVATVGFGETFIVTQDRTMSDITIILNAQPEAGQGHALRLGVKAILAQDWSHAMVVLGDMPLVSSSHLVSMISKIEENQVVVSVSEGDRLPPAIFPRSALELIAAQNSTLGARAIFDQLTPVEISLDPDSARDVDTPADLATVAAIMKARST